MNQIDRRQPPPKAPIRPFQVPRPNRRTLGNGLALLIAEDPRASLASATLLIRTGAVTDLIPGVADLTTRAIGEGDGPLGCEEFSRRLDHLGASLQIGADHDSCLLRLTALPRHFAPALRLIGGVVRAPAFRDRDLGRIVGIRVDALRQSRRVASTLAAEALAETIFEGTPYAAPSWGRPDSVATITPDHLRHFHESFWTPSNALLAVAGPLTPTEVRDAACEALGDWARRQEGSSPGVSARAPAGRRVIVIDRPGAVQSTLRVGHLGVARTHTDDHALQVVNSCLGGKFTSRVNLNLRERLGITYGARTHLDRRRQAGLFVASSDVDTPATATGVGELLGEIQRAAEDGFTAAETLDSVSYILGVFPYLLETADDLVARLVDRELYGLPETYLDDFRRLVAEVDADRASEAARQFLRPGEETIVVVGPADRVAADLEIFGPVELRPDPSS